jgi:hypothetical protein
MNLRAGTRVMSYLLSDSQNPELRKEIFYGPRNH